MDNNRHDPDTNEKRHSDNDTEQNIAPSDTNVTEATELTDPKEQITVDDHDENDKQSVQDNADKQIEYDANQEDTTTQDTHCNTNQNDSSALESNPNYEEPQASKPSTITESPKQTEKDAQTHEDAKDESEINKSTTSSSKLITEVAQIESVPLEDRNTEEQTNDMDVENEKDQEDLSDCDETPQPLDGAIVHNDGNEDEKDQISPHHEASIVTQNGAVIASTDECKEVSQPEDASIHDDDCDETPQPLDVAIIQDEKDQEEAQTSESDICEAEIEVLIGSRTVMIEPTPKKDTKSCFEQFVTHFGKYLYGVLWIICISLIGVLIGFNEPDAQSATVIGLVWFVMIACGIVAPITTVLLLKMWTQSTWFLVFFLIYISLIVDVIAIGFEITVLLTPLLIYAVVKILIIFHSYQNARVDGKHFVPSIIKECISKEFFRDNCLYQMMCVYVAVLFIQCVVVSLGCMAFVADNIVSVPLYIIALVLFIWLNNTFRHFAVYMQCRLLAYKVSETSVITHTESLDLLKQSFHDALNKFASIEIASLAVTTTPITYGITNVMQGIRNITLLLVLCCLPFADEDDDGHARCCCIPHLIVCVSAITNGIAYLVRWLSKWTLRITAKTILIQAGFQNDTFFGAIKAQNKTIFKENKDTFGSDMVFLDNCMLSTITHLCILISSFGAWITLVIEPSAAVICWIAGYIACRTMLEMVDVLLQFFLVAWFIEPRIIYENEVFFAQLRLRMIETLRTSNPNEDEAVIQEQILLLEAQLDEIAGLRKTTDPNHVTNVQHIQHNLNAVQQTSVAVNGDGQVIAAQQNKAITTNTATHVISNGEANQLIQRQTQPQLPQPLPNDDGGKVTTVVITAQQNEPINGRYDSAGTHDISDDEADQLIQR